MTPGDLDVILQSEYPLLVLGQMAAFEPLAVPGSRLLLTADGLKLEAHNGMAHAIRLIHRLSAAALTLAAALGVAAASAGVASRATIARDATPNIA